MKLRPGRDTLGIALVSGAVMFFELALLRVFSFTLWHHFAFMVISVALLGFGVSGVFLALRTVTTDEAGTRAARAALGFAAGVVFAALVASRLAIAPARALDDPSQALALVALYLVLAVPFACAGFAVAVLLDGAGERAGRLYGADLLGAAAFGIASIPAMRPLGADGLLLVAASVAALAAAVLATPRGRLLPTSALARTALALTIGLAALVPFASRVFMFRPSADKGLAELMRSHAASITSTAWSPVGRVDSVEGRVRVSWTSNRRAGTRAPEAPALVIDGDASTPVVALPTDPAGGRYLEFTLSSAAHQLLHPRRALVIGSGGGIDVVTALHHGARHVDAVEINDAIRDLVTTRYEHATRGLFHRRDVSLHAGEGRSFVHASQRRWDLIQISLIDTWAASASGAYAMTEGYLYTVEAFEDYLRHLAPGGAVAITRWSSPVPRESMRLVTIATEALERVGVAHPSAHVLVLGLDGMSQVIVRSTPFDATAIRALSDLAARRGFRVEYAPGSSTGPYAAFLGARVRSAFFDAYPFDVRPTSDDAPFFFQFAQGFASTAMDGSSSGAGTLSGRGVLALVLAQAACVTALLLVVPFVVRGRRARRTPGEGRANAYFFALGVGFMIVEMSLMQRFTLFLGHPLHAVACVLGALLASAALGSALSARVGVRTDALFGAVLAVVLVAAYGLPTLFARTIGAPLAARVAIGVVVLLPIGFFLGMPFPVALARLDRGADGAVARAWAANGCGSVVGPIVAPLLAFDLGFTNVTLVGALVYGLAYFAKPWTTSPAHP